MNLHIKLSPFNIITACVRGTSREKLFAELGLTSLYDRRRFHRLSLFYKILNQLTPEYLRRFIPDSARILHNTRTKRHDVMLTRTLKFRHSFFPDTSNSWNYLSSFIKNAPTLNVFKKRYMEFFIVTPKPIYGIHNPVGIKYLTRLRVGLSHLRAHKYQHNFVDTTTQCCSCANNVSETIEHYLLYYPNYSLVRSELFEKLRLIISLLILTSTSYTCDLLLYGDSSLYKVQLALLFQVKDLRYLSFLKTDTSFSHFVDCEISSFSVFFSRPLLSMGFEGLEEGIGVVFVYLYVCFLFHFLVLCIYVSICCYW